MTLSRIVPYLHAKSEIIKSNNKSDHDNSINN